ncbi:MAG: ChaN family lipoprotein [Bacteroidota bacterium]
MKYLSIILIAFLIAEIHLAADDKPAYKLFESDGGSADYGELLDDALEADIVFFGEQHNNPICHWLQFELTKSLYDKKGKELILGAEMFEADDQLIINEYLTDKIAENNFKKEAKLWNNYKTDYKPLLEFANDSGLTFVATNIPRRYAALVAREGLEALEDLSRKAKQYMPPLPIEVDLNLPGYKKMEEMFSEGHGIMKKANDSNDDNNDEKKDNGKTEKTSMPNGTMPKHHQDGRDTATAGHPHAMNQDTSEAAHPVMKDQAMPHGHAMMSKMKDKMEFLKMAQAIKDATMAHFIQKNYKEGGIFLHYNGTYHSNNHEGIVWFIKRDMPGKKVITIATVLQNDIEDLEEENEGLADYILVIPSSMTTTY